MTHIMIAATRIFLAATHAILALTWFCHLDMFLVWSESGKWPLLIPPKEVEISSFLNPSLNCHPKPILKTCKDMIGVRSTIMVWNAGNLIKTTNAVVAPSWAPLILVNLSIDFEIIDKKYSQHSVNVVFTKYINAKGFSDILDNHIMLLDPIIFFSPRLVSDANGNFRFKFKDLL